MKKEKIANIYTTVLSNEEEEIEQRRLRGVDEVMDIHPTKDFPFPFDNYTVKTETGVPYQIEIRSLSQPINACSCKDFEVNTFGTCKHIEGVLHYLCKKKKVSRKSQSQYVEIYFNRIQNKVSIAWPDITLPDALVNALSPYFSADNTLLADPIYGMASLELALSEVPEKLRHMVRLSPHLKQWYQAQKRTQALQLSRKEFLEDVKAGKRSLQMLNVPLYPYQEEGMLHLAFKGKAILADEMGLGKTIQAIAACELLRRLFHIRKVLVISPASLKGEWEEQVTKFTQNSSLIVQGARGERLATYAKEAFFYFANYEQVRSDFTEIQNILAPDVIILDEAQRIKNWQTKTSWAIKQLNAPYAFVLTGTPLENRIEEIYSILQVVDPHILGPLFQFNRHFFQFNAKGKPIGYKNLDDLHRRLKPVLMRRLKKEVETQLPERTVNTLFVEMDPEQKTRYEEYNGRVAKLLAILKKRPLSEDEWKKFQMWLACMRMLADTPYILDEKCKICPKLEELKPILQELLANPDSKVIIFSEWERMLVLVKEMVEKEYKIPYAWHTGTVPQQKRREDIKKFKEDPTCRLFLTTDSGSTGLNLQAANTVINLDLPWNPARMEQRIARAWRKNQTRTVQVINFVSQGTIEQRMLSTLAQKKALADGVIDGLGDFSDMPLPSARKEILERLHLLDDEIPLEPISRPKEISQKEGLQNLTNDIVSQLNDRLDLLEVHENLESNKQTVIAVVDQADSLAKNKLQTLTKKHLPSQSQIDMQLIDRESFALLHKLAEAGFITIHPEAQSLFRSPHTQKVRQTEQERKLNEAQKLQSEAQRKMRMSQLLQSGGFYFEALPAAINAVELSVKGAAVLQIPHAHAYLIEQMKQCTDTTPEAALQAHLQAASQCVEDFVECVERFVI